VGGSDEQDQPTSLHPCRLYFRNGDGCRAAKQANQRRERADSSARQLWLLLATGDKGTKRRASRGWALRRSDPRFAWPPAAMERGRQLEARQRERRPPPRNASTYQLHSAWPGLERGPSGLAHVFMTRSGPQHQLDSAISFSTRDARFYDGLGSEAAC